MRLALVTLLASLLALLSVAASAAAQSRRAGPVGNRVEPLQSAAGLPVVSGRPVQGDTLISRSGSWSATVMRYTYRWLDCSARGTDCAPIPGASSPSYVVQGSDIGYAIESKVTACAWWCRSRVSAPTAVVTTASGTTNPSGAPVPPAWVKDNFGTVWKREGYDNFTIYAPLGSWGSSTIREIVYRGDGGLKWQEAPDGWSCNGPEGYYRHCYEPSRVLSVHNGELDFYLHDCIYPDGFRGACGAKPRPLMPSTGTPYQK
jgi:hypothetical protein